MKLRLSALVLALCLLLPTAAQAAQPGTGNFVRQKTYTGQFSDLTADSVFFDNVAALYEYGLSVGKVDGTYGLQDAMTVGEIVIFAARIRSIYALGDAEAGAAPFRVPGEPVYQAYLAFLQAEGVLGYELDGTYGSPATRAQVAHVLAGTLPAGTVPEINYDLVTEGYASRRFIPDVTEYTPYFRDILTLYRQGVSVGSDAAGTFRPDAPITRGAAAAMLTRMVDPALRLTPAWVLEPENSALGTTLASLVAPAPYIAAPATEAEMDQAIRYMLSQGQNTLSLQYPSISMTEARKVMEQALAVVKTYCEQSYNYVTCDYRSDGKIILTFSAAGAGDRLAEYRQAALDAAIALHDRLWAEGVLTSSMSDYEKAQVYYILICENCAYDYAAGDESLAHIPYSLLLNGSAVCDGYTGAYNLLLKLEGIPCTAMSTPSHIWTVAELDGTTFHIDTTWGDMGDKPNMSLFAMTPEMSRVLHGY